MNFRLQNQTRESSFSVDSELRNSGDPNSKSNSKTFPHPEERELVLCAPLENVTLEQHTAHSTQLLLGTQHSFKFEVISRNSYLQFGYNSHLRDREN
jgi:hypothetical protein